MKQFNLQEVKNGKPVCTRDGREARIICFDVKNEGYPIVAAVKDEDGVEQTVTYTNDGYCYIDKSESADDLMMRDDESIRDNSICTVQKEKVQGISVKSFDFEQAKSGKPVCTRDGHDARILCFDFNNEPYHIVAAVSYGEGKEDLAVFTHNGRRFDDNIEDDGDLVMKGEKKRGYVALFKSSICSDSMANASDVYESLEKLRSSVEDDGECLGIIEVEWEE